MGFLCLCEMKTIVNAYVDSLTYKYASSGVLTKDS